MVSPDLANERLSLTARRTNHDLLDSISIPFILTKLPPRVLTLSLLEETLCGTLLMGVPRRTLEMTLTIANGDR